MIRRRWTLRPSLPMDDGTYWKTDYRYFDQYTLAEMPVDHVYGRLHKMMRMNYDIHAGAIGGLAGKILAFMVSLVIASLPVTAFCIWYGCRKKEGKQGLKSARPIMLVEKE